MYKNKKKKLEKLKKEYRIRFSNFKLNFVCKQ